MGAATLESKDVYDAIEMYFEKGWTDGLPVVPPRPEVVKEFIATVGRDPEEVLITFNETNMQCTVELAAVNAVMAGCRPEYFPVVLAAVECWNDPRWGSTNVYIGTASTGGAGQMVIVNGPIRNELKMNSGVGLFGPGFRANATIGRAVRLILMNALGMQPQVFDMSIMGHPGKYSYCIAEAEEDSPWEPYHVERGFHADENAVTVIAGKAPLPVDERSSDFPEGILNAVANFMPYAVGTGVYAVVMGKEHADIIGRKNGWTKKQVKEYLFEKTRREVKLPPEAPRRGNIRTIDGIDYRYLVRVPDDLCVIVAGGGNGGLTAVVPTHVYNVPPGDLVTRKINRV